MVWNKYVIYVQSRLYKLLLKDIEIFMFNQLFYIAVSVFDLELCTTME